MLTRQAHLKNLSPVYISAPGYVHVKFIQRLVTGRNMVTGENQLLALIKPDCAVKKKKRKEKGEEQEHTAAVQPGAMLTPQPY